jgi:hypothetical protein
MSKRFAVFLLVLCGLAARGAAADDLMKGFASPPESARPWVYWFWLNGNITPEGITADLEAMKRVGIGGVLIMEVDQGAPLGPVPFGGPKWRELFKYVCSEAGRLGLEVNMNNDAGWCGSGGPWITPDVAQQNLVWSETVVAGPQHFDQPLLEPRKVADYYRDVAVLAFPTPKGNFKIDNIAGKAAFVRTEFPPPPAAWPSVPAEETIPSDRVLDLSAQFRDGRLSWQAPEGKWTVLRIGHTVTEKKDGRGSHPTDNHPAPKSGCGLECDKLSPAGADAAFAGLIAKLASDVGPLAGKTLVSTHIDSWETGSQNWTPRFRQEFQRRRGYDPLRFLPAMTGRVVGSLEVSERFLWDVRQTVSDLLVENYAGRFRELAHKYGLRLSIEAYDGTPCDDMSYAGQADEPMAEFWAVGNSTAYSCVEMASAAHVYGKRILGAEAFTSTDKEKWLLHPASIKTLGDWAFCEGINRFVFHRYAMQPWLDRKPGMSMGPWGLHYERTQTWWEQSKPWHEYLARCQFLLQQGLFVADICYLEPEGSPRRFTPPPAGREGNTPDRPRYNFDGCTPEVVLTRMSVRDGRIVLPDGMSYRLLVLPEAQTMTPPLLARIAELAEAGATVVGPRPVRSPSLSGYPECDGRVKELADRLWGNWDSKDRPKVIEHRVGKGKIICGKTPEEVLAGMGVPPDFVCEPGSPAPVRYIHRRMADGTEFYFLANKTTKAAEAVCWLRGQEGRQPEFWWPETGRIEPAARYGSKGGVIRLPLRLEAAESVFVVFRAGTGRLERKAVSVAVPPVRPEQPQQVAGPWELEIPSGGQPQKITLEKLISWSEHPDAGVKYFSGTATYRTTFALQSKIANPKSKIYLDLGNVQVIAEAKLNGRPLGILWKPPYRAEISKMIQPGDNTLEVKVTNLWINRMIGDEQLPEDSDRNANGTLKAWPKWLEEGGPSPTGRQTFTSWRLWPKSSTPVASGLLGPVTLEATQQLPLEH